jgi:hypothetical protein
MVIKYFIILITLVDHKDIHVYQIDPKKGLTNETCHLIIKELELTPMYE